MLSFETRNGCRVRVLEVFDGGRLGQQLLLLRLELASYALEGGFHFARLLRLPLVALLEILVILPQIVLSRPSLQYSPFDLFHLLSRSSLHRPKNILQFFVRPLEAVALLPERVHLLAGGGNPQTGPVALVLHRLQLDLQLFRRCDLLLRQFYPGALGGQLRSGVVPLRPRRLQRRLELVDDFDPLRGVPFGVLQPCAIAFQLFLQLCLSHLPLFLLLRSSHAHLVLGFRPLRRLLLELPYPRPGRPQFFLHRFAFLGQRLDQLGVVPALLIRISRLAALAFSFRRPEEFHLLQFGLQGLDALLLRCDANLGLVGLRLVGPRAGGVVVGVHAASVDEGGVRRCRGRRAARPLRRRFLPKRTQLLARTRY
mmetsp:Transcript_23751/g.50853  ORF Transcript_23751/g.50853 Transcript_23751/m.50853 type:complete len:369 (+) Transcript_23751:1187-2293(+)